MRGRWLRSTGAVLAGVVAGVALSLGTDKILRLAGVFPPLSEPRLYTAPLLLLATVYRSVYGVAASYLTALLAPDHPMAHALALGVLAFVASLAGAIAMWSLGSHWYPVALVVLAIPCAWAGGKLFVLRRTPQPM